MIPKSGGRFSEKIMLKEKAKVEQRAPLIVKYKGVSVWRSREGWWKRSLARFILTAVAGRMR
jgi:hypothetical protein